MCQAVLGVLLAFWGPIANLIVSGLYRQENYGWDYDWLPNVRFIIVAVTSILSLIFAICKYIL